DARDSAHFQVRSPPDPHHDGRPRPRLGENRPIYRSTEARRNITPSPPPPGGGRMHRPMLFCHRSDRHSGPHLPTRAPTGEEPYATVPDPPHDAAPAPARRPERARATGAPAPPRGLRIRAR